MAALTLRHHRGDRLPLLAFVVEDDMGVAVPLADAEAFMALHPLDGGPVFVQQAFSSAFSEAFYGAASDSTHGPYLVQMFIVDPAQGIVTYDWLQEEADGFRPGVYDLHVHVRYPLALEGSMLTAPTDRHCFFVVSDAVHFRTGPTGAVMVTEDAEPMVMVAEWGVPMTSEVVT
jgi:hypothetical protein